MNWLMLMVLVPLILAPILWLCGFAGCGSLQGAPDDDSDTAPSLATDLVATGKGTKQIDLTWTPHNAGVKLVTIERANESGSYSALSGTLAAAGSFSDGGPGLQEGTTFHYQLAIGSTVVAAGGMATTFPEAPTLVTLDVDLEQITIVWKNNSVNADQFVVQHRSPGGVFSEIIPGPNATLTLAGPLTTFTHKGLLNGSAHEYQIRATVGGFDQNVSKRIASAPLELNATTWKPCYRTALTNVGTVDFSGRCLVQEIKKANLQQGGNKVRITLRGTATGNIAILKMSISKAKLTFAANTSQNEWDSEVPPTEVPLAAGPMPRQSATHPGAILLGNIGGNPEKIILNPVSYNLDSNADLHIAFDIAGPASAEANGLAGFAPVPVTDANTFFSPNAATEAMTQDRSSGPPAAQDYRNNPGSVFIVEQIDVL